MLKTPGNFFWFLLLGFSVHAAQPMTLDITDENGTSIQTAAIGQPLTAHVTLENIQGEFKYPTLHAQDQVVIRPGGFCIKTIQGKRQATFKYQLCVNRAGIITIGPAIADNDGTQVSSNTLMLSISNKPYDSSKAPTQESNEVFLQLSLDKQKAFVGEKITGILRFYFIKNKTIQLQHVKEPESLDITSLKISEKKGPIPGKETINSIDYDYFQWQWDMYATQEGTYSLPAYQADFIKSERDNNIFNFFSSFNTNLVKRAYSNAVTFKATPLPSCDHPVQAVGIFTHGNAALNATHVYEGEGTILSLELVGDADFDHLNYPSLRMPQEIKWYESKQQVVDVDNGLKKKTFEYVIQPIKAGDYEIPSQSFTYFDVAQKKYKTLITLPLMLHVAPSLVSYSAKLTPSTVQESLMNAPQIDSAINLSLPVNSADYFFSWRLFFLLCSAFILLITILLIKKLKAQTGYISKKNYFAHARTTLQTVKKENNYKKLHTLFMQLLSGILHIPPQTINAELIEIKLTESGLTADKIARWNLFLNTLKELAFSQNILGQDLQMLYEQADQWLVQLEQLL